MQFSQRNHDLFIPDLVSASIAARRTTHLGIGAHQDDLEFMALHGILAGYQNEDQWFGGVTCTDGSGSSRSGEYADFSDDEMRKIRAEEQRQAARIGQYSFVAQLGHPSSECKNENHRSPLSRNDIKVVHDVSPHPELAIALNEVFQSHIGGGKRCDRAVEGRRRANATFYQAHNIDGCDRVDYAIDLTDLTTSGEPAHRVADRILKQFREEILLGISSLYENPDQ